MLWGKGKPYTSLPELAMTSEKIILRPAKPEDWPQWAKLRAKNREFLQPFEPLWGENCLEEDFFTRRLERQAREWHLGQAQAFLIFDRQSSDLIGGMNINNICRGAAQYCSLGYWIAKDREGQGFMREALKATIEYCFIDLKLHRINCACLLHNSRSKTLLLKAGFEEEGMAKKYLQINGLWQDHILFGLPIEHWKEGL